MAGTPAAARGCRRDDRRHRHYRVRGHRHLYRNSTITYTPGLTTTPQAVHFDETNLFTPCTSTDTTLAHGSAVASVDFNDASCTSPPGLLHNPAYTITWSNGNTSTLDLTLTDVIVLGNEQVTGIGTVTAGQFTGGTATIIWLYPVLNPP